MLRLQSACVGNILAFSFYSWAKTVWLFMIKCGLALNCYGQFNCHLWVVYGATTGYPFWRTATANQRLQRRRRQWSHCFTSHFREWRQVIYFAIDNHLLFHVRLYRMICALCMSRRNKSAKNRLRINDNNGVDKTRSMVKHRPPLSLPLFPEFEFVLHAV